MPEGSAQPSVGDTVMAFVEPTGKLVAAAKEAQLFDCLEGALSQSMTGVLPTLMGYLLSGAAEKSDTTGENFFGAGAGKGLLTDIVRFLVDNKRSKISEMLPPLHQSMLAAASRRDKFYFRYVRKNAAAESAPQLCRATLFNVVAVAIPWKRAPILAPPRLSRVGIALDLAPRTSSSRGGQRPHG